MDTITMQSATETAMPTLAPTSLSPTSTAHPAYPTVPSFPDELQWIGAYMIIHVGSDATRRWGYILWFAIAGIFVLFSICHALRLRGGILGAYWSKWALRRRTLRNKLTGGKPVPLMPNSQILTLAVLTIATLALAFIGPDYIAPKRGAFDFRRRGYVDPALAKPFQPQYDIDKAWWTSGNRTGILAFALLPLCILFALKAPPFAIFAIPHLVQLHFDKLSWLHRWSGRLIWFITFLHVLFWVIQLGVERHPETGLLALHYAFEYDKFIYAWIAFGLLTLLIICSFGTIRQKHYETFYFLHVLLVPLMIVMAALHHPPLWWWCWVALGLWFGERLWRLVRWLYVNKVIGRMPSSPMSSNLYETKAAPVSVPTHYKQLSLPVHHRFGSGSYGVASPLLQPKMSSGYIPPQGHYIPPPGYAYAELLSGMTTRVTFIAPNSISWAPGQHFLLNIPSISRFTSHPFTCGSIYDEQAPEDAGRALVFFIRAKNGWTKQLWDSVVGLTTRGQFHPPGEQPPIGTQVPARGVLFRMFVDGPFGSVVRARFEDHSTILIVAGGSGVSFGLSLLIYVTMCLAGRNGKHLGGRAGGWGMKGYRTTRVRFIWIVRDFAHIVWCATAIRRCLDMLPNGNLQIDIFVTNFKKISDKKTGPPSPLMPMATLPAMDSGLSNARGSVEMLYPPVPKFARSGLQSRSSSSDSIESLSAPNDNNYIDLTYFTNEYGDEERDPADPEIYRQNYIIDLTNFEGENDLAIQGEDTLNRRILKTGKARRARTRKAAKANSAKRELEQRSALANLEGRGRPGWQRHSHEGSGDLLSPDTINDRRRSARSQMSASDYSVRESTSRPPSRPPSRAMSPAPETSKRTSTGPNRTSLSEHLDVVDPMFEHTSSPYHKELGMSNDNASLRGLVTDTDDNVRLEIDEQELRDVSIVSEHTRAGRPKLDRILADEVETANGSVMVTCCGPTPLNALVRKAIAAQIKPARVWRGDKRGSISLVADEFNY